ncbi:hypothetical protein [Coleofasciculus chthonoplastes]|uniref:hypothetical protein n=1 Tax=Coleofasciculus chthonoplastes TaxID=64178 RepID=UPI0040631791
MAKPAPTMVAKPAPNTRSSIPTHRNRNGSEPTQSLDARSLHPLARSHQTWQIHPVVLGQYS